MKKIYLRRVAPLSLAAAVAMAALPTSAFAAKSSDAAAGLECQMEKASLQAEGSAGGASGSAWQPADGCVSGWIEGSAKGASGSGLWSGKAAALQAEPLTDGIYAVDGKMVKADKLSASMSDEAVDHTIMLIVKDGEATVQMNFRYLVITSFTGYLKDLYYFTDGYVQDKWGNPTAGEGSMETAEIVSCQYYTNGEKVEDTFGTDYPDIVRFPLLKQAYTDGLVPLQVFVPIMEAIQTGNGTQTVYLRLDWDTLRETTAEDPAFTDEDKQEVRLSKAVESALAAAIASAKAIAPGTYTAVSYNAMTAAIASAETALKGTDEAAAQQALAKLNGAISGLKQERISKPSKVKAASAAYNKVKIRWSAVSGAAGYEVCRYNSSTKKYTALASVTGTSYTAGALDTGTSYSYAVRAYKSVNGSKVYSGYSGIASAKPALAKAASVKAKNSKNKTAVVSWKKVSGASGYEVYRSTKKSSGFQKAAAMKKASTVKYTNKKLAKGKTYYYKVKAYRTVKGKKVYAPFSAVASVKVKK